MVEEDRSTGPIDVLVGGIPPHRAALPSLGGNRSLAFDLWMVVVFLAVVDVGLTYLGLQYGLVEANPIASIGLSLAGVWALIAGKGVAIGFGVFAAAVLDRQGYLVPAIFLVIWGAAVATNTHLLLLTG